MASYSNLLIHLLFSTKNCRPLIDSDIKDQVYAHLVSQLSELGCKTKMVAGMPDHVHILFRLNPTRSLCDIVKQIKGNSSHWINDHDLVKGKFVWEKGFSAYSESQIVSPETLRLLKDQEAYHKTRTYLQEVDELISHHDIQKNEIQEDEILTENETRLAS